MLDLGMMMRGAWVELAVMRDGLCPLQIGHNHGRADCGRIEEGARQNLAEAFQKVAKRGYSPLRQLAQQAAARHHAPLILGDLPKSLLQWSIPDHVGGATSSAISLQRTRRSRKTPRVFAPSSAFGSRRLKNYYYKIFINSEK